ncbi:IS481 family transposase [Xylophilus rhododendri]|uniref:IS481 family transposase n=1 Tax=Xylophilus rhododendri TaxID=2697032 RepID=A0A857J5F8_9BURK|nr:IS481 family transposase [Xylophilus rhododendri]QHI98937.1 IS481 family transposase [Xylophilus rhododendri]
MPWQPRDLMSTKQEFVELAQQEGANRRELCRRFNITPKAGYALLKRFAVEGQAAFVERSRRPVHSPLQTPADMQSTVLAMRREHPAWGARKICRRLLDLGHREVPATSTVTDILRRNGLIPQEASAASQPWQRFEHEHPNALWQLDFKGHFETAAGRCNPLTLLDDHSRFNLAAAACARTDSATVQSQLQAVFERYGLPARINADNGAPWGVPSAPGHLSGLDIWFIRLGMRVSHSAPYHPQTNGKLERFHRSLKAEVLNGRTFDNLAHAQDALDRWRAVYNHERPHEGIAMQTPAQRYRMSPRAMPQVLPEIEYAEHDHVVTVGWNGFVKFQGHKLRLSHALHRLPVAFRPDPEHDGCFDIYFSHHCFMRLDSAAATASN